MTVCERCGNGPADFEIALSERDMVRLCLGCAEEVLFDGIDLDADDDGGADDDQGGHDGH